MKHMENSMDCFAENDLFYMLYVKLNNPALTDDLLFPI